MFSIPLSLLVKYFANTKALALDKLVNVLCADLYLLLSVVVIIVVVVVVVFFFFAVIVNA